MRIRQADPDNISSICAFDQVAQVDSARHEFISNAVGKGIAHVATLNGAVVGYAVIDHSFFDRGCISVLYVHLDPRREGIGSALVRHLEGHCQTDRIFTSTNESNIAMQALLARLDYEPSGVIHNLDPGDPELVYSKNLRR